MIARPNAALAQIHTQIMWNRLIAVVEEQAQTMIRTAFSTSVREALGEDPFSGAIFVFRSKRADRIKILAWDGSGLVLFWKRLEHGAFRWPPISDGIMRLTASQLAALVDGMDWSRLHARDVARPTATS